MVKILQTLLIIWRQKRRQRFRYLLNIIGGWLVLQEYSLNDSNPDRWSDVVHFYLSSDIPYAQLYSDPYLFSSLGVTNPAYRLEGESSTEYRPAISDPGWFLTAPVVYRIWSDAPGLGDGEPDYSVPEPATMLLLGLGLLGIVGVRRKFKK